MIEVLLLMTHTFISANVEITKEEVIKAYLSNNVKQVYRFISVKNCWEVKKLL
jgi:hypothetical protein